MKFSIAEIGAVPLSPWDTILVILKSSIVSLVSIVWCLVLSFFRLFKIPGRVLIIVTRDVQLRKLIKEHHGTL